MSKKKKKLKLGSVIGLVFVLGIALVFLLYMNYTNSLKPLPFKNEKEIFIVDNGSTVNTVLDKLEAEGLIANADYAKIYAKLNFDKQIYAGTYILTDGMNVADILEYISENNAVVDQISITIPEGTWSRNVAEILGKDLVNCDKDGLIALWNDKEFLDEMIDKYYFIDDSIYHEESHIALEGYLFPETYFFNVESDNREATIRILDVLSEKLEPYRSIIENGKYSYHEIMTLASVVQFESKSFEDMQLVAGVFYNRLDINMPLQSSATVCYAKYDTFKSQRDCEYNIEVPSLYNTYVINGLPIGPICNPGYEAIQATINPKETKYYFFVSDSKGVNHYAVTYDEHLKNVDKYLSIK